MRNVLSYLVTERERLQLHGGSPIELDANLKAIAAIRTRLARTLADPGEPPATC